MSPVLWTQMLMWIVFGCTLEAVFTRVRENLRVATKHQKREYDRKATSPRYRPAQGVWVHDVRRRVGRTSKLDYPWSGPYSVIRMINDVLCEIQRGPRTKPLIRHVDKLLPVLGVHEGDWVHQLTRQKPKQSQEEVLKDIEHLFNPPEEPPVIDQEIVPEPRDAVETVEEIHGPRLRKRRRRPVIGTIQKKQSRLVPVVKKFVTQTKSTRNRNYAIKVKETVTTP